MITFLSQASIDPTLLTIGGGICTALVGAVGVLWKEHRASKALSEERHQKCEDQHTETRGDLLNVTREVGELKGRVGVAEQLEPTLKGIQKELTRMRDSNG